MIAALRKLVPAAAVFCVLAHVEEFPSERLVKFAFSLMPKVESYYKGDALRGFEALRSKVPAVNGPLDQYTKKQKPTPRLTIGRVLEPREVGDLNRRQQRQLARAGELFDGKRLGAAKRLEPDGDAFLSYLRITELHDAAGRPAYDVFEYNTDTGSIFKAGTVDEVAELPGRHRVP